MDQTLASTVTAMTDEQVVALNKKLTKKFAITMAGQFVVASVVVVAGKLIEKHLDAKDESDQD